MTVPANTPWGEIQQCKKLDDGIFEISTASHGGFWIAPERRDEIAVDWRRFAAQWSHGYGAGWFEEDCAASGVIEAFPSLFPADWQDIAKKMRDCYLTEQGS